MTTRQAILIALFAALIAVLAQLAVPLPFTPVPVTMQLVGVMLAGAVLGRRGAVLAVISYLLLGAAGAPVFSLARGGLQIIIGPTGGYLWGFIPCAFLLGLLRDNKPRHGIAAIFAVALLGLSLVYLTGTAQLALVMKYSPYQAFLAGTLPFIPADLLKVTLACTLSLKLNRTLQRGGINPAS